MDAQTAAEMFGTADYRNVGRADHSITEEERAFACDIASELAAHHGIDLAAHVRAHRASLGE